ncbi:MAG: Crp/Fnr family transcriptional regulator [Kouleothrix sp.]|nr:Crp/Fnr family transcriptional regulator [Kouleothrix sp.]
MNKPQALRHVAAFAGLSDDELVLLARGTGSQAFERGEIIFQQGSIGSALYIIVTGQVRIYTTTEAGQELTVTIFHDGDFFGEMALFDGQPRAASASAMCRTTTLTLHRAAFLHTISACPPIAASVLEIMALRLRQSNTVAEQLASLSASQRVVRQLRDLAARYGIADGSDIRIDLHLTQDDLASLSGTTRETVNRVLSHLRDQGLIRVERARVSVLNMPELEHCGD